MTKKLIILALFCTILFPYWQLNYHTFLCLPIHENRHKHLTPWFHPQNYWPMISQHGLFNTKRTLFGAGEASKNNIDSNNTSFKEVGITPSPTNTPITTDAWRAIRVHTATECVVGRQLLSKRHFDWKNQKSAAKKLLHPNLRQQTSPTHP